MCGIAGFVGNGNESDLKRMIASIKYRGPDDQGFFIKNNVGLAHARLSILDLSPDGHQPMFNQRGDIAIVFNGEIYNHLDVKQRLLATGKYKFESKTDTEVIIYAYEEWGTECFEKLNGMFAIGLYDFRSNKLILVRDRIGKKPLYWGQFGDTIIFGSELKAVLQHPLIKKEIDDWSKRLYLHLDYIPTPYTIYKNIFKLEPAAILVFSQGKVLKQQFWKPTFLGSGIAYHEAIQKLDKKINEATKIRLMSDVPLGIFLSGGIDSATIAYYAQKNSVQKIKTFSIGFSEKSFDETRYALQVTKYLGTEHCHKYVTAEEAVSAFPEILEKMDEPFADASIIPTYLLSKFTKEKVTVALGGDGGDELFAGYPTFQAETMYKMLHHFPGIDHILFFLQSILSNNAAYMPKSFLIKQFRKGIKKNDIFARHALWLETFSHREINHMLNAQDKDVLKEYRNDLVKTIDGINKENKVLGYYLRSYLMDQVLVKVDRASMLNSLEVRAPFLDYTLVDFVNSLPYSYKYSHGKTKVILKDLMRDKLPAEIVARKKKGFGVPVLQWYLEGKLPRVKQDIFYRNQKQFWNQYILINWLDKNK